MPFRLDIGREPGGRRRRRKLWTRDTTLRLLGRAIEHVTRSTDRGLGVDGQPLGRLADGSKARIRRTGALVASGGVLRATRKGGQAGFPVAYAKHVFKRYPNALGFGPDFKDTVNAEISETISAD